MQTKQENELQIKNDIGTAGYARTVGEDGKSYRTGISSLVSGAIGDDIEQLENDVEALHTTVGEHTADIQNNSDDISDLQTLTSGHTTSIGNLQTAVGTNTEDITDLKEDFDDFDEILDIEPIVITPVNIFDGTYTAVIPGSSAPGTDVANANNKTTDFISAQKNDKIWCGYTDNINNACTSYNPVYVTEYDSSKTWLKRSSQFPSSDDANGKKVYTVTEQNTAFIRVSFSNSMVTTSGRLFEIAKNIDTTGYIYYKEYFTPYSKPESVRLDEIEKRFAVDNAIIDCWGDSRTEMIAGDSTSYCDYLQTLLGSNYHVCNFGVSSQSSGMCAARLGSNKVFVTLNNNSILASGSTQLTEISCSSGYNKNLYAYSSNTIIPCRLNGVSGALSRSSIANYDNVKFTRYSDGGAVPVHARTPIVVDDYGSKNHICILWWGKNDFDTAANYVVSGILDNYRKAVEYLGHNKFVILGETCSISEAYEPNGDKRIKLETINATLANEFPNNFININDWLSSTEALTSVGLTADATDLQYIEKGWPCYHLMVYSVSSSDTTHPNEKGREAIANKIYAWMKTKGWVS